MAWFGTRTYVGASWTVMAAADGSMTWTEITATNPFPNTIAVMLSFRDDKGANAGFSATVSLSGLAQTKFLARNLTVPNSTTGWFTLLSFPTPIVPSALVYWFEAARNHTEVSNVPIEQLDADGFPIGDTAAQPRPTETETAQLDWPNRPLPTLLSAEMSDEEARGLLQFFRAAQSAPGSLDAAEPFTYTVGLLLDEEAAKFHRDVGEIPER
jgi:hypothetical protein